MATAKDVTITTNWNSWAIDNGHQVSMSIHIDTCTINGKEYPETDCYVQVFADYLGENVYAFINEGALPKANYTEKARSKLMDIIRKEKILPPIQVTPLEEEIESHRHYLEQQLEYDMRQFTDKRTQTHKSLKALIGKEIK